ncbi:cytochrome P450 4g15-like [Macrosteles quadrilineatus]|uniref:cytochrome P450 4g15-like n=1 Tax=Macrosteles quadrilineatus TaxID=74068 RepID=UPI0023E33493|nr:cytochrome P450 4g15-like [Macrosteles quadrilineatus]
MGDIVADPLLLAACLLAGSRWLQALSRRRMDLETACWGGRLGDVGGINLTVLELPDRRTDYKKLGIFAVCVIIVDYLTGNRAREMMAAEVLTVGNMLYYGILLVGGMFCWFQWRYRDLIRVATKLPVTFPTIPLLGHGYLFWGLDAGSANLLEMSRRAIEKSISTICLWVGPLPLLIVHEYEDIRTIMNSAKTIDKSDEYEFFKEGLDSDVGPLVCSILLSPGPVWKVTRRHLNTMFTPRNLEQMIPVFNQNSRVLVDRLNAKVQGPTQVNIVDFTMDAALKAYTKEQYELKIRNSQYNEDLESERQEPLNIIEVYTPFQKKNPQFREADMWGEMLTLYETGSDSVAITASYCLMALAQHPEYQEKAYNEIMSVVGPDDDVTTDHAKQLTYLTQCIKETLRRFTLVPYLLRRASEDLKLSDCTVPAGHTVIMSIYGIHMNPKLYPDPTRFDPERFSPENSASRDKFAFVPFSGGPRDCIGKEYGLLFAKVMLSNIMRKYRVKPVVDINKLRRRLAVVLVSGEGYNMILEPRNA